jgi:hypothetical protein
MAGAPTWTCGLDYSAAARAALTMPAPKKELRLALP